MNQPKLTITLLGGLNIDQGGTAVTGFASRKADALFIYLACNPRPHPRETLATLFWPDNDQTRALANLSVALSSLRKQLDLYLIAERHTVAFNSDVDFQLDVALFETAVAQAQMPQAGKLTRTVAAQLQTAVALYSGDFLAGFNIRNAPEFEAWVLLEQERLRQQMVNALADLVNFHQQRTQFGTAIGYAQQLLALDSLQEETHRQLMKLYALDNQRPAALAQYQQCATILAEELGVEPDEETVALYESIRDNTMTIQKGEEVNPSPAHNLATATTTFIGREAELAQVEKWLMEPNGRLLTIIGPGGMGKTRLAQEAARTQLGKFSDGVWLVSLVPQTNMSEVVTAVSQAIGLTLSGKEAIASQLLNHLKPLEMLLVLDNLEHLLTTELRNFLSQLAQEAPDLRLIITSRERLNLQAESLLELHGLPFPVTGNQSPITDFASAQLFINRVQRIQAAFDLGRQETAVTQLCQLVGGLPLALELAATWTRVLAVGDIVVEIQRGLDALATTLHDLPERHRSLRAVIESSWQMLPADEQALFCRLAVFRGGFTRTAAQQVANAALPQLVSLVDRSFLRLDEDQRFRRHPLLLQFAQEQLAGQPEAQAQAKVAHAHFFAQFVQMRESVLKGEDAPQGLAEIEADLANIRAAWQWGLRQMDEKLLLQMIDTVSRFFADRSRLLEAVELFTTGLQQVEAKMNTAVREQIAAKMQVELGFFLYQTGQYAEAETALEAAYPLTQKHNLAQTRLHCLKYLGDVLNDRGERNRARPILEEALQLCRETDVADEHLQMIILNTLGNLEVGAGAYETARRYFDEAMVLARGLNNTLRIAILHNNIAIIANRQEKHEEAIRQYKLAHNGFKENKHDLGVAATCHNIGMAYASLERYEEALSFIQKAYRDHEKIGHRRGMVGGLAVLGTIYQKQGQRRKARRYFYDSLRLAQAVGVVWAAIDTLVEVAELEMSYGRLQKAARLLSFSIEQEAIEKTTLQKARKLLSDLRAELPGKVLAEIDTAVPTLSLDAIIDQLVKGES